jgi:hypothetical protein
MSVARAAKYGMNWLSMKEIQPTRFDATAVAIRLK